MHLLIAFFIFLAPALAISQPTPIHIGSEKQLFIDHRFIEQAYNVKLTVNPPKYAGPVILPERPWEVSGLGYNNVIDENGLYRMWYMSWTPSDKNRYGGRFICHAVSTDGLTWEKKTAGLVEFEGSKENNIVPTDLHDSGTVFFDPNAPKDSRYKMITVRNWGKPDAGIFLYLSPDGLDFRLHSVRLLDLWPDTQNQVFYDSRLKKYVAYLRSWEKRSDEPYGEGGPLPLRTVSRMEIDNILKPWPYNRLKNPYYLWGDSNIPAITEELRTVMACDGEDPPESDLYTPCVVQYPWAADVYFAFPSLYRHFPPPPDGQFENDGILDIQIAASRDGANWNRFRGPYIGLNTENKGLYMGIGMIRQGDKIYQYYLGTKATHGDDRKVEEKEKDSAIYCAVQRLDGFISADAAYTGGAILTPAMIFRGNALEVNVNTSAAGELLVEIQDESGAPVQGFTLKDADPVQGNYIGKTLTWKGKSDISRFAGIPVRLKFTMRAAKLYAFQCKL